MKVRKIVAGLAAVSMLAAFSAQAAFAADTVTITGEKVNAEAGAEFTLDVELSGVPSAGISVCEFALTYDSSLVTVTGVTAGAVANTGVDNAEKIEGTKAFEADYSTAGVINVTYTTGVDDKGYWITKDGVFLTVTGTVKSSAADGDVCDFKIGAINRETTEGSGETNKEISVGYIGSDYTVTAYGTSLSDGSVTVGKKQVETDPPTSEDPGDGDVLYGDADCSGAVDILDVIVVNKNLLGAGSLSAQGQKNADVTLDGKPGSDDALAILKYVVKVIDKLPV
ncbi:MAG: hypothetical protein IKC40_08610 [Oscillospiraceae bacterium]|nr:hypothetical protein [Oscillospiraceae bacterium]MBR6617475.1 hypothetical protein [Oscillospiraceae bacterium]